jgi:hypothetical protein
MEIIEFQQSLVLLEEQKKKPKKKDRSKKSNIITHGVKDYTEISDRNKKLIFNYHATLPDDIIKIIENGTVIKFTTGDLSTISLLEDLQIIIRSGKSRKFTIKQNGQEITTYVE